MLNPDEAFLGPRHRRLWPYTVAADIPVIVYVLGAAAALALPGDTTKLLPNYRLLGQVASEPVLLTIYGVLGIALLVTTATGPWQAPLISFGLTALWLLFVSFLQLWSLPQGPGWVANLALAMLALISFYRRAAAGWVRYDVRHAR